VIVFGTSGAGKSAVAAALAALYEVPHVDLDDLATDPNWRRVPDDVFRARVQAVLGEFGEINEGRGPSRLAPSVAC
jgi:adenylate kinase family enzyme